MDLIVNSLLLVHLFLVDILQSATTTTTTNSGAVNNVNDGYCSLLNAAISSTFEMPKNCKILYLGHINITHSTPQLFESLADGLKSLSVIRSTADSVYLTPNLVYFKFTGIQGSKTQILIGENGTYQLEKISLDTLLQPPVNLDKLHLLTVFECYRVSGENLDFTVFTKMTQLERIIIINSAGVILANTLELSSLRSLAIRDSPITFLNINDSCKLPELQTLSLENNTLETIPMHFNNCSNLTEIFVLRNNLQRINLDNFASMNQLEELAFSNNKISTITTEHNVELARLKRLNLFSNKLTELNITLWSMPALEYLSLGKNYLKQVPGLLTLITGKVRSLMLDDNPWDCEWLTETAQQINAGNHIIESTNGSCSIYGMLNIHREKNIWL